MLKIMIVDNESTIRKGLTHCIRWESLGCVVTAQAVDGIDAMEQLPVVQPDIIISDIRMPGMDGLTLAQQINAQYPHIKVIILTGFPDFSYAQRAIEYRVVDFVLKPTSVESLTHAIERAKARIAEERSSQELTQRLATKSEHNLILERSMLLHDLMQRIDLSHLYVLNRMAQLGLDLNSYHILRLDVTLMEHNETEPDFVAYLHQAQDVLQDGLDMFPLYFVPHGDQTCYAVVCTSDTNLLYSSCCESVDIVHSLPLFTLSIGISCHFSDPLQMAEAAEQADQAAQFSNYTAEQTVQRFDQLPEIPPHVLQRLFDDLCLLKSAIENHSVSTSMDILHQLFTFMREHTLPVDTIYNVCLYIHQFCINLLFLPHMEQQLSTKNPLVAFKKRIDSESIDGLEYTMQGFVKHILEETSCSSTDAADVIHTIQTYIVQHCANDLSLESISNMVYLSPSYLSRLFKRETGENLSTYVQNMRIEQAKMLLRTTSLKTYEVAERVGLPDPVYFSRIFKKVTGIRPKDFRNQNI